MPQWQGCFVQWLGTRCLLQKMWIIDRTKIKPESNTKYYMKCCAYHSILWGKTVQQEINGDLMSIHIDHLKIDGDLMSIHMQFTSNVLLPHIHYICLDYKTKATTLPLWQHLQCHLFKHEHHYRWIHVYKSLFVNIELMELIGWYCCIYEIRLCNIVDSYLIITFNSVLLMVPTYFKGVHVKQDSILRSVL